MIEGTMRALSLTQPWATLVAIGAKRIETRSWATDYRGLLAIHAAKAMPVWARRLCEELLPGGVHNPIRAALRQAGYNRAEDLPRGAIVAVGNLHRVGRIERRRDGQVYVVGRDLPVTGDELAFGDYTPGRYALVFTNVRRLPEPVPCRGALGLWDVPAEVLAKLADAGERGPDA